MGGRGSRAARCTHTAHALHMNCTCTAHALRRYCMSLHVYILLDFLNLARQNSALFSAMVQRHCRNNAAGTGLVRVALVFTRQRTSPPGESSLPLEQLQVWQEECLTSPMARFTQERQWLQQAEVPVIGPRPQQAPDAARQQGRESEEGE